jgi:hypothetical protein
MGNNSVLNPVKEVPLKNGETVTVRELRAIDGLEFIKRLSGYFGSFQSSAADGGMMRLRMEVEKIITGATEVAEFLVLRSTGKDRSWMEQLSTEDLIDVLTAAIDLNVSEGLIKKARGVFDLVRSRIGSSTTPSTTSPAPSTS